MVIIPTTAAICALFLTGAAATPSVHAYRFKRQNASAPIVDLDYAIYQGTTNNTSGLNTWKGIRYAAPPTGNLRWQAPQAPLKTNRTVISASAFGPQCPQAYPAIPNAPFLPGNEDCLYLNVQAPVTATNDSGLPVFVWIHGGGYGFGNGQQDFTELLQANENGFVTVGMNYRLGAFGFLASNEVKKNGVLNAGLLDQAFALEWVQKYIHLFGGDPKKVTIAGESAGGGSVMLHAIAKGGTLGTSLFRSGIGASPYLPMQYSYNDTSPNNIFKLFASKSGCGNSTNTMDCLKKVDTTTLQYVNSNVSTSQAYATWGFLPVTDGTYITDLPSKLLNSKKVNGQTMLVSSNANEGDRFVAPNITTLADLKNWFKTALPNLTNDTIKKVLDTYPSSDAPTDPTAPRYATNGQTGATAINVSQIATGQLQRATNIYAEVTFVCPSYWLSNAYAPYYSYHYQYSIPLASHADDVSAYFGPAAPNQSPSFTATFRRSWGNFIRFSDPGISDDRVLAFWPTWDGDKGSRMVNLNQTGGVEYKRTTDAGIEVSQFRDPGLQNDFKVVNAYSWEGGRGARCDFWKSIAEQVPM